MMNNIFGLSLYGRMTIRISGFLRTRAPEKLISISVQTSCAGGSHNMPPPLQVDLWPFDLESGARVTCDVGYLCANFNLPRSLCSRL